MSRPPFCLPFSPRIPRICLADWFPLNEHFVYLSATGLIHHLVYPVAMLSGGGIIINVPIPPRSLLYLQQFRNSFHYAHDALLSYANLFRYFTCLLEYVIRKVQANQKRLKLDGTHQLTVYVDVFKFGGSIHKIKKNTEALVDVSKQKMLRNLSIR